MNSLKNNDTQMYFDTERLISLKENFTGQKFQWIKTDRPQLLGKVVSCRDVVPLGTGRFDIIFDDGSKVDSEQLNQKLMMLHGDMQPLSKLEVESIYGKSQPKPQLQSGPISDPVLELEPVEKSTNPSPVIRPVQPAQPVSKVNMFSMFTSEAIHFPIKLEIKLPDKKLLKLMYENAENKEVFVEELSEYTLEMINKSVVKESLQDILKPASNKK
jgi:hypothetical protein